MLLRPRWVLIGWTALCPVLAWGEEPAAVNVAEELGRIRQDLKALSDNLTKTLERVSEHETQIGQLKTDLAKLKDLFSEELQKQQQILEAISRTDSSGRHVPRLSAAMQSSPEFRREMQQAVNDSLERTGTLRITNRTDRYQTIYVNRAEHGVSAGETVTLKVPVGTVATQIPGREMKTWAVTAPTYEQSIDIVPPTASAPSYTYTYVARPVSVLPPIYYYDPLPLASSAGSVLYYWP